jgi:hypothetical protein
VHAERIVNQVFDQYHTYAMLLKSISLYQPLEIGIAGHQSDEEDLARLNERVSEEMFEGIIREVVEETGVPASSLVIGCLTHTTFVIYTALHTCTGLLRKDV